MSKAMFVSVLIVLLAASAHVQGIHIVDPPLHVPVPAPAVAKIKEAYKGHFIANPPMAEKLEHAIASEPAPYKKPL